MLPRTPLSWIGAMTLCLGACSDERSAREAPSSQQAGDAAAAGGAGDAGSQEQVDGDTAASDAAADTDAAVDGDPTTCSEAERTRSYVGCDFWPTVTFNPVFDNFDFAAVVANGGERAAEIRVERDGVTLATTSVAAGALGEIVLPWVSALKGPTFLGNTTEGRVQSSVRVDGGAYHLISDVPVTVWQFNPLQYEQPLGECTHTPAYGDGTRCLSVSNDAALLIPSSALTGAYRVFGRSALNGGTTWGSTPGAFAITATADGTSVDVKLAAPIAAGPSIDAKEAGEVLHFTLDAGDVVQLLGRWAASWGEPHADLSGSVVVADRPVQVIAVNPLSNVPDENTGYADHLEETVLPGEVLGELYVVTAPSAPAAGPVGHVVRLYGNVDGTTLSYPAGMPAGAPSALDAGQVVELGPLSDSFVVAGDQPFAVASFMLGGTLQDPSGNDVETRGDPAFSMLVTPAQFREHYSFLAPDDYLENYADIIVPAGASVQLDGALVAATPEPIGAGWSLLRVPLSNAGRGVHSLQADAPVGLQVMGFGHATAYYYPGGLNLKLISEPPVIVF